MRCLCLTVFWLMFFSPLSLADDSDTQIREILAKADPEYGEYLSSQCVTCHHATGEFKGIPTIVGLQADYLVKSILDYKHAVQGRTNPAMVNIAKNLSDEELGSLAKYFSKQQSK